jgi:hypothetical protein
VALHPPRFNAEVAERSAEHAEKNLMQRYGGVGFA